jgi:hypothetical protein
MAVRQFNVYVTNVVAGPLNPAVNVWHTNNAAMSDADIAAQLIGFYKKALTLSGAISCAIDRIQSGPVGGPLTDVPFPTAELEALNAAVDAPYVAAYSDYGASVGSGEIAAAGISITVTEFTALGGRHNGRKYIPWTRSGAISGGIVSADTIGNMRAYYLYWLLATNPAGGAAAGIADSITPVVGAANSPVSDVKVSQTPARLRSRIR